MVLDALAGASNAVFTSGRYGSTAEVSHKGRKLVLLKPSTYMNLSGNAVRYRMQQENIPVENVLVVVDDVALDLGTLRLRGKGSNGGHNGLKHIDAVLGHNNYARLRFGIGHDYPQGFQVDYVLGEWTASEKKVLPERIDAATEAIRSFATAGLERTMNVFNTK
jgi:PTH1 family peptidyl-tRNA hydrolase